MKLIFATLIIKHVIAHPLCRTAIVGIALFGCSSCASISITHTGGPLKYLRENSETGFLSKISKTSENHLEAKINDSHFAFFFEDTFESELAALQYLLERKLLLQRAFQSHLEPYFGLTKKTDCTDKARLNESVTKDARGDSYFFIEFPVEKNLVPFDCDKTHASLYARYEFHLCAKSQTIYEVRIYNSDSSAKPETPLFACK